MSKKNESKITKNENTRDIQQLKSITIDRRQLKTRASIFSAFADLLAQNSYSKITVQEIIDEANIGRSTFYSHFETKDDLLRALCEELFDHILNSYRGLESKYNFFSDCHNPVSVFEHLLRHLKENDRNMVNLLNSESSDIFLRYFKNSLISLIKEQFMSQINIRNQSSTPNIDLNGKISEKIKIPEDFLINHIAGAFVEMTLWWIKGGMKQSTEELDKYFRAVIEPIL